MPVQLIQSGERGEVGVRLFLIPVGDGGHFAIELLVQAAFLPAERLDGDLEILFEADGVGDVPAVQAELLAGFVDLVRRQHLRKAGVGRGEGLVFVEVVVLEIVGAAKIIFGAGAADGGELGIAVHVEFDFAFTPPTRVVDVHGEIGADVLAFTFDVVENGVKAVHFERVLVMILGVEISGVAGNVGEFVVHLVVERHAFGVGAFDVLHGDAGAFAEGHGPVAIEAAAGINADGERADLAIFSEAAREEIPGGALDGGVGLAVPVDADDGVLPVAADSHPNLMDAAGAFDVGKREGRAGLDADAGRDFPALAQLARGVLAVAIGSHAGLTFFAGKILGADGARFGGGSFVEIGHTGVETGVIRMKPCDRGQQQDGSEKQFKFFHIVLFIFRLSK